jgi:4-amino-4-deoxy-L-arabinose transferase-like glycosyltransferase
MGLSSRVIGYSSASLLVPQALATIASVGLLYATVRRAFGPAAGLLAGAMLALTPVTVAIGRFDNPDALLVLLLVASAWLFGRAIENGRTRDLAWGGAIIGLAFMTKMLQGWMVAPALFGAYLIAGPPAFWTRVRQLAVSAGVMVAVSAAWPLAVTFWPGSKPYIGGSTDGSVWNLILGYNGFGRIFGEGGRGPGGAGGGGGSPFGGSPGWLRMLNEQVGGQVAWLLPLAVVGLVAGLWLVRRAPRTDKVRAAWLLWGGWALVHIAVFSSQKGIFHPYYVSALAPAVAALAGAGAVVLWKRARSSWPAFAALAVGVGATAWLSAVLLARAAGFAPELRWLIPGLAVAAVAGGLWLRAARDAAPGSLLSHGSRGGAAAVVVAGLLALTLGPASYSLATAGRALSSGDVAAGPASAVRRGGPGGPGGRNFGPPPGAGANFGPPPGAGAANFGPPPGVTGTGMPPGGARGGFGGPGGGRGQVSDKLISYLEANQGSAKYLVAGASSMTTGPIIIKTGKAVVTWGGFNGADNALSVSQLEQLVRKGELRYVLVGGGGGPGGDGNSSQISTWVTKHGTKVTSVSTTGGATLYEVTV